jgi:hypothetical protein
MLWLYPKMAYCHIEKKYIPVWWVKCSEGNYLIDEMGHVLEFISKGL